MTNTHDSYYGSYIFPSQYMGVNMPFRGSARGRTGGAELEKISPEGMS